MSASQRLPEECLRLLQEKFGIQMEWSGDLELLEAPSFALAQSRKPRQVKKESLWVQETRAVLEHPELLDRALLSSLGALHHELPVWLATEQLRPRILVLECLPERFKPRQYRQWQWDYGQILEKARVLLLAPVPEDRPRKQAARMQLRDRLLFALADWVIALRIRPGGVQAKLLEERFREGRPTLRFPPRGKSPSGISWFKELPELTTPKAYSERERLSGSVVQVAPEVGLRMGSESIRQSFEKESLDKILPWLEWQTQNPGKWLFHYTRSRFGPWPGERQTEYLAALLQKDARPRGCGWASLERILEARTIRASEHLNRGGHAVCCWTEQTPPETGAWTRWDPPLKRWTFEPYAIGIRQEALHRLGAEPVEYLPESELDSLPPKRRYLYQKHAPPAVDRRPEKEWRFLGDLSFAELAKEDLVVLTATSEEARRIQHAFGLPTLPVGGFWPDSFQASQP